MSEQPYAALRLLTDRPGDDRRPQYRGGDAARSGHLLGIGLVVLSTVAIAIVPTFARLAYDGGSDPITVITARSLVTAVACFLAVLLLRRPLVIPRGDRNVGLLLGVVYGIHLLCFLGAVAFMPVNMVILIYFLHPLMIGLLAMLRGRDRPSLLRLGALAGATAGLGLAIGVSFADLDAVGMALAFAAAMMATVVITASGGLMRGDTTFATLFWMMLSAAIALAVLSLAQGELHPPTTGGGWLGLGGVALAHTAGTIAFFGALPLLGAVRAAMITNIEPILGILFAMLILGERVSVVQGVGIALVIGAIFAMEAKPAGK